MRFLFYKIFSKKAQLTLEYTLLIVAAVTALICMFNYVRRGVQGRFKIGADALSPRQYETGSTIIRGR